MSKVKSKPEPQPTVEKVYSIKKEGEGWVIYSFEMKNSTIVSKEKLSEPDLLAITVAKLSVFLQRE